MSLQLRAATTIAAVLAMPLSAQETCPNERTDHVAAQVTIGPLQSCGGFNYQIGGVQVGTPQNGCPLFVIYTPPHEVAVTTKAETKVTATGKASPITMVSFVCSTDWFLFIPTGSTCSLDRTVNIGSVERLVTVACP
jgi:hypothetical protein